MYANWTTNPTFLTNLLRASRYKRRGTNMRGATLARWGGLGNHRYQVGFSGDVNFKSDAWKALAFQPYFTATASNVLHGYWSHDIVGPDDAELETRWIQWGTISPIMRIHDRGMGVGSCA